MSEEPIDDPLRWADGAEGREAAEMLLAAREEGPTDAQKAALAVRLGVPLGRTAPTIPGKALSLGGAIVAGAIGLGWLLAPGSAGPGATSHPSQAAPASSAVPASAPPVERPVAPPGAERSLAGDDRAPREPGGVSSNGVSSNGASSEGGKTDPANTKPANTNPAKAAAAQSGWTQSGSAKPGTTQSGSTKPLPPSEVSLIRAARAALSSDPEGALSLTRTHRSLYPSGVLSQEREVIAIEALSKLGRSGEAKQKAETFRAEHPDSGHRPSAD